MAAPRIRFSTHGADGKISSVDGFSKVTVTFSADLPYAEFECRATKVDEDYGWGKGTKIVSFPQTPAETERSFDICDDFLLSGDGVYRISLYAQGLDGSRNDNHAFLPVGDGSGLRTADGETFFCMR